MNTLLIVLLLIMLPMNAMQKNNFTPGRGSFPENANLMQIQDILIQAVINEDKEKVHQFSRIGRINSPDSKGRIALIEAARHNKKIILPLLITIGADPNIQDQNGRTALHEAAMKINFNFIEMLLQVDSIKCDIRDEEGKQAIELIPENVAEEFKTRAHLIREKIKQKTKSDSLRM